LRLENQRKEVEEPSTLRLESHRKKEQKDQGDLPGFRVASNSDYKMERLQKQFIAKLLN